LVRDADRGDQRLRGAALGVDPVRRARPADRAPPLPAAPAGAAAPDRARGAGDLRAQRRRVQDRHLGQPAPEGVRPHQAPRARRGPARRVTRSGVSSMTIDELAAQTGVPTRTIRFYQARGALMRPEIRGRVAYYGDAH